MSNPLLTETPVVTINGQEMNLPRLSLGATFSIVGLIKEAATPEVIAALIESQGKGVNEFEAGVSIVSTLFEIIDNAEERIYKVISKVLKIEEDQVEELSLEDIVSIGIAFKDHPDVSFFTKRLPEMLRGMTAQPMASPMRN